MLTSYDDIKEILAVVEPTDEETHPDELYEKFIENDNLDYGMKYLIENLQCYSALQSDMHRVCDRLNARLWSASLHVLMMSLFCFDDDHPLMPVMDLFRYNGELLSFEDWALQIMDMSYFFAYYYKVRCSSNMSYFTTIALSIFI